MKIYYLYLSVSNKINWYKLSKIHNLPIDIVEKNIDKFWKEISKNKKTYSLNF